MVRTGHAVAALAAALAAMVGGPAAAEVRDAVYRGTMVCDKLPFTATRMREAIDVTIAGGAAQYSHVVRLGERAEATAERGSGTVNGQLINLKGSWSDGKREYKATYGGTFVRRSATLTGTQTWTDGGKTISRACAGAIKRPLRIFLPRKKPG